MNAGIIHIGANINQRKIHNSDGKDVFEISEGSYYEVTYKNNI